MSWSPLDKVNKQSPGLECRSGTLSWLSVGFLLKSVVLRAFRCWIYEAYWILGNGVLTEAYKANSWVSGILDLLNYSTYWIMVRWVLTTRWIMGHWDPYECWIRGTCPMVRVLVPSVCVCCLYVSVCVRAICLEVIFLFCLFIFWLFSECFETETLLLY